MIPYGRPTIEDDDVAAVAETLRSGWLTTGPKVAEFEQALAAATGARHAVAVNSGTAALHAAYHALGLGPGDEVVVPPLTFAATATAALHLGARPVFADVDPDTLLLDPDRAAEAITPRTRAIVGVDYAGQPCDARALGELAADHGAAYLSDACHALGAADHGRPVGSLARLSAFSFHPVKHITTAEGGAVTTDDPALAEAMRRFRNHAIGADHRARAAGNTWWYEVEGMGLNYRLSDIQCALGLSQLRKLPRFLARRRAIAARYDEAFAKTEGLRPLAVRPGVAHAYHLYVVQLDLARLRADRAEVFRRLRERGIGANVHYIPVPWHPLYQRLGYDRAACPRANAAYERILTLPVFPGMTDAEVETVIATVGDVVTGVLR